MKFLKKNKGIVIFYLVVAVSTLMFISCNNDVEEKKPYLNGSEKELINDIKK